jgi:hypothetical protein
MATTYTVAWFSTAQAYGGPEEGGWWYDTGAPLRVVRTFRNEDQAYTYCRRLNETAARLTFGPDWRDRINPREKSSVLCDSYIAAEVCEGPPAPYPAERPHYD